MMPSRNLGEIKQQVSAVWKCCGSMGVCAVRAKNLLGRRVSALAVGPLFSEMKMVFFFKCRNSASLFHPHVWTQLEKWVCSSEEMCQELLGSCWRSWLSSQRGQDVFAGVEGDLLTFILNWEWGRGCSTLLVTSARASSLYSVLAEK